MSGELIDKEIGLFDKVVKVTNPEGLGCVYCEFYEKEIESPECSYCREHNGRFDFYVKKKQRYGKQD